MDIRVTGAKTSALGPAVVGVAATGRRRMRPDAARTALMDAAESEMGRRGVNVVSVSDLVAISRCPNGSLYHHFGSKTGLLVAVLERGFARVRSEVSAARQAAVPAAEEATALFEAVARSVDTHPNFHQLVIQVFLRQGDEQIDDVIGPFRQLLLDDGTDRVRITLSAHGVTVSDAEAREVAESMVAWMIGLFVLRAPDIPGRVRGQMSALLAEAVRRAPARPK